MEPKPREELTEQDLPSQLGIGQGGDGDVDCSLKLGPPTDNSTTPSITFRPSPPKRLKVAEPDSIVGSENGKSCAERIQETNAPKLRKGYQGPKVYYFFPDGSKHCLECKRMDTPKWRKGQTLCNACGLRIKKHEKKSPAIKVGVKKQKF